ncbi:hypothetical protein [Teredinibacter franksiae]|uniref:hypothetical protein n=1 Tax=Teredinibacter franksiae TaxID=2761453 RepID=UPI0016242565|nr:hypothetical protein [Teredinibacter franksiae]
MYKSAILFFALSCTPMVYGENNPGHAEHADEHKSAATHKNVTEHIHPTLNHGAKWQMDHHTRKMFTSMSERVHTEGDLKDIGGKLNDDLQKLIEGCTMTGAAHDQLHIFLTPYIPAVAKLAEQGTKEAFQEVKRALDDYQSYFE